MGKEKVLAVDAGNTALKCAVISDHNVLFSERLDKDDFPGLLELARTYHCDHVAITSVRSGEKTQELLNHFDLESVFVMRNENVAFIPIQYETIHSLGKDRLCNAVAAHSLSKTSFALSVDIGTCIKFDLVHFEKGYLGGSISPGIQLRYKSLHTFTDNLPLLQETIKKQRIGQSTADSIRAGVLFGIESEINDMIKNYEIAYPDLTIFVTGGDHRYFDIVAKNDIFAHENLTLIGLYEIYLKSA